MLSTGLIVIMLVAFGLPAGGFAFAVWVWNRVLRGRTRILAINPATMTYEEHRPRLRGARFSLDADDEEPIDVTLDDKFRFHGKIPLYLVDALNGDVVKPLQVEPGDFKRVDGKHLAAVRTDTRISEIVRSGQQGWLDKVARYTPWILAAFGLVLVVLAYMVWRIFEVATSSPAVPA